MSKHLLNRIGFIVLGLTNNFAYVIMLSAAYDLLKQSTPSSNNNLQGSSIYTSVDQSLNSTTTTTLVVEQEKYCNEYSTSTILIADTLPSLATKLIYPFLLVGLPISYKAITTAILSAAAFIITGVTSNQVLIFVGVICASFSSGLGESTYISNTHLYGDSSLSGWSIGTGAAGLFGAIAYAVLRDFLSIKIIMFTMLIVPIAMMYAFFWIIKPVGVGDDERQEKTATTTNGRIDSRAATETTRQQQQPVGALSPLSLISSSSSEIVALSEQEQPIRDGSARVRDYGAKLSSSDSRQPLSSPFDGAAGAATQPFNLRAKLRYLPSLAKYAMPLLLVYFAEYFINQGLSELIYYPEVTFLAHPAQYRWFQVSYQLGVMISRSSLDFIQIKNIWTMSLLQAVNAILFLAHTSKLIHIPNFYIVVALIIYEGLLGGFTYVNAFYRIKKEVSKDKQEFCMSTVTISDSLGVVFAGIVALPVHNALCKLYD